MGTGIYQKLGVSTPFDPDNSFISSPFFRPGVLGGIRSLLGGYALFTSVFVLVWEAVVTKDAASYFSYFTDLSYLGITAYFIAAGVQTVAYARWGRYPLRKWGRVLQALHTVLFSTIVTFPIIVTIVFWVLLASPTTFATPYEAWGNISRHAMNTVFALFEIIFSATTPLPWLHLPITIVLLALYLGVAYITYDTQGFYTYSFLNPSKEHAFLAVYIIGITVTQCIVFIIVRYLIRLRLTKGKGVSVSGVGEGEGSGEAINEWEEVVRPSKEEGGDGGEVRQEEEREEVA